MHALSNTKLERKESNDARNNTHRRLIPVEKPANYTTVSKRLAQNLNRVLRCVRNLANPSGCGAHPLFSPAAPRFKHPREGMGWPTKQRPEAETEMSTRKERKDAARREGRVERETTASECIVPCWTFPLLAEWNRFLRKSKHSVPPPNIAISSASQFARTFVDFQDAMRRDDRRCRVLETEVWNFRRVRWYVAKCLVFVFPLRLHLPRFEYAN